MGRWKGGAQGAYWDPNDSGPNQVAPPAGFDPNTGQPLSGGGGGQPANGGTGGQPQTPAQGTANAWNREQFRDAWQSRGMVTRNDLRNYAATIGATVDSAGRVRLPSGEVIDMMEGWSGAGETGQGRASWGGVGGGGGAAAGAGGAGGGAGAGGGGLTPAQQSERDQLYNELLQRSRQSLAVDRNDPTIRAQADPFIAQMERQRRNDLADLAEREGQGSNLRGEERLGRERAGQQAGQLEAELIGREIGARRNEIQAALLQRGDMLTNEQKNALQRELAQLEDATRRLQIQSEANTASMRESGEMDRFLRNLAAQQSERDTYWDRFDRGLMD